MSEFDTAADNRVCSPGAWLFSRLEEFWKELQPLTPFGRDVIAGRIVHSDPGKILSSYDDIDAYESFIRVHGSEKSRIDRLAWHLGRIPRLPSFADYTIADAMDAADDDSGKDSGFDVVELFLFKKFLSNYKACHDLLDDELKERFGFSFLSEPLFALLGKGGSDPETFQISERYDEGLRRIRSDIGRIGEELEKAKRVLAESARDIWGLDFMGRDFLTVPIEKAVAIASESDRGTHVRIAVESYDDFSCLVRILPDPAYLALELRKEALRDEERSAENSITSKISKIVQRSKNDFEQYMRAAERLDLARCRYLLKKKYDLCRPDFSGGGISIESGRFLPLLQDCKVLGTTYVPIEIALRHPVAVLFGSNMGGKTVALQSLLFFQIVAQSGLYVPAKAFSSQVFDTIEYSGEGAGGESRGLSSFGYEIHFLSKILRMSMTKSCLVAFDEFAHTTGSEEAEALLAAVIHHFSGMERCAILFATHCRGIARDKNVHWLKMAGLDIQAARIWFSAGGSGKSDASGRAESLVSSPSLEERIRRINRLMRYEILEDKGENGDREDRSDALEIASLLGLDETIVEEAVLNLSVSRLKYREKHPE
ncbi:MAG: hypothetical protein WCX13_00935 [Candidatus Hydrogenedentales bacterium]